MNSVLLEDAKIYIDVLPPVFHNYLASIMNLSVTVRANQDNVI